MKFFIYLILSFKLLCNLDPLPVVKNGESNLVEVFNESTDPNSYFKSAGLQDEIDDINNNYRNPNRSIIIDRNTILENFYKKDNRAKKEDEYEEAEKNFKIEIQDLDKIIDDIEKNKKSYLYKNYRGDFVETSDNDNVKIYPKYENSNPYILKEKIEKQIKLIEEWRENNKDYFKSKNIIEKDNKLFSDLAKRIKNSKILNLESLAKEEYEKRFFILLKEIASLSSNLNKILEKNEKVIISYLDEKEIEGTLYIKIKVNAPLSEGEDKKKLEQIQQIDSKLSTLTRKINLQSKNIIFNIERGQILPEIKTEHKKTSSKDEEAINLVIMRHTLNFKEELRWDWGNYWYVTLNRGIIFTNIIDNEVTLSYDQNYFREKSYSNFNIGSSKIMLDAQDYLGKAPTDIYSKAKYSDFKNKEYNFRKKFNLSSYDRKINFLVMTKCNFSFDKNFNQGKICKSGHKTNYMKWCWWSYYYDYQYNNISTISNFYNIVKTTLSHFRLIKVPNILLLRNKNSTIYSELKEKINKRLLFNDSENIIFNDVDDKPLTSREIFRGFFDLNNYVSENKAFLKEILTPSVLVQRMKNSEQEIIDISFLKGRKYSELFDLGDGTKNILKFRIEDLDFEEITQGHQQYLTSLNTLCWLIELPKSEELKEQSSNQNLAEEIDNYTLEKLKNSTIRKRISKIIENYIQDEIIKLKNGNSSKIFDGFDCDYKNGIKINLNSMLKSKNFNLEIEVNEKSNTYSKLKKLEEESSKYQDGKANFRKILESSLNISGKKISIEKNFNSGFLSYELVLPIDFKDFYSLDLKTSKIDEDKINIKDLLYYIKTNFVLKDKNKEFKINENEKTKIIRSFAKNLNELIYDIELNLEGLALSVPVRLILKPLINLYPLIKDIDGFGSEEPKIDIKNGKIFYTFQVKKDFEMTEKNIFSLEANKTFSKPVEVTSKKIVEDRIGRRTITDEIIILDETDKIRLEPSLINEKIKLYKDIKRYDVEDTCVYILKPENDIVRETVDLNFFNFNKDEELNFKKIKDELEVTTTHNVNEDKLFLKISAKYSPNFEKYFKKINYIKLAKFEGFEILDENNIPILGKKSKVNVDEYIQNGYYFPLSRQLRYIKEKEYILILEIAGMKKIYEFLKEFLDSETKNVKLKIDLLLHVETDKGNLVEDENRKLYIKFEEGENNKTDLKKVIEEYQISKKENAQNLEIDNIFSHVDVNVTTFFKEGSIANKLMFPKLNIDSKYKDSFYYSYSEYNATSNCGSIIEIPSNAEKNQKNKIRIAFSAISDERATRDEKEEIDRYINRDKVLIYIETATGNILINENEIKNLINTNKNKGFIEIPLNCFENLDINSCSLKVIILPTVRFRGNLNNIKKDNGYFKGKSGLAEGHFQTYNIENEFEDYFAKFKKQREFKFPLKIADEIKIQNLNIDYTVIREIEENNFETQDIKFLGKAELNIPLEGYKSNDNIAGIKAFIALGFESNELNIDNITELRNSLEKNLNGILSYEEANLDNISNKRASFRLSKISSQNANVKILGAVALRNGFEVILKDVDKIKFKNSGLKPLNLEEAIYLPKEGSLRLEVNTEILPLNLRLNNEDKIIQIEDQTVSNKIKRVKAIFEKRGEDLRTLFLKSGDVSRNYQISFITLPKELNLNSHNFLRRNFSNPSREAIFFKRSLDKEEAYYTEGEEFTWGHLLTHAILETENDKNFITKGSNGTINIEVDEIQISLKTALNENLENKFIIEKSYSNGMTLDLLFNDQEDIFTEKIEKNCSLKIESPSNFYKFDLNKNISNIVCDQEKSEYYEKILKYVLEEKNHDDNKYIWKVIQYFSKKGKEYKPTILGKVFRITEIRDSKESEITDELVGDIKEEELKFYKGSTALSIKTDKCVYPIDNNFIEEYLPFKGLDTLSASIEQLGKEDYIFYLKTLLLSSSEDLLIEIFQAGIQKFDREINNIGTQLKNEREYFINSRLNQIESRIKDIEYRRGWWKTFFSIMKFSLNAGMSLVSGPVGTLVGNVFSNYISAIELMATGNATVGLDLRGYSLGLDLSKSNQGLSVSGASFSYGNYSASYNKNIGFSAAANYSYNGFNTALSTTGDLNFGYDVLDNSSNSNSKGLNLGARVNVLEENKNFSVTFDTSNGAVGVRGELGILFGAKGLSFVGEAALKYVQENQGTGQFIKGDASIRAELGDEKKFSSKLIGSIANTKGMWSAKNLGASLSANYDYSKQLIYSTAGLTYNGVSILDLRATTTWSEDEKIKKLAGFDSEMFSPAYIEKVFKLAGREIVLQIEGIKREKLVAEASSRIAKKLEEKKEEYKKRSEKEKNELIFQLIKEDPSYKLIGRQMHIDKEVIDPSLPHLSNLISNSLISNEKLMKIYDEIYEKERNERDKKIQEQIDKYAKDKVVRNGKIILNVNLEKQENILNIFNKNKDNAILEREIDLEDNRKIKVNLISPVNAWKNAFLNGIVLVDKEKNEYKSVSYVIADKNGNYAKKIELDSESLKNVRDDSDIYFNSKKDSAGNDIVIAVVQDHTSEIIALSNQNEKDKIISGNIIINKAKLFVQCEDRKFDSGDERFVASVELDRKSSKDEFKVNLTAAIADNFFDNLSEKDIAKMDQDKFNQKLRKISLGVKDKFEEIKNEIVTQIKSCAFSYEQSWDQVKDHEKFNRQVKAYSDEINRMFEKDANNILDALNSAIKSKGDKAEILKNLKDNIANNSNFFYKAADGSLKPTGIAQTMILNLEDDVTNLRKVSMKSIEEKLTTEELKSLNRVINDKNLTGKEYIEFFENIFNSNLSEEQKRKVTYEVLSKFRDKTDNISGIQDPIFYTWMKANDAKLFSKIGEYDILQDISIKNLRNSLNSYAAEHNLRRNKEAFDIAFELAEQGKILKYGNSQLGDKEVNRIYSLMQKVSIKEENGKLVFKGIAENIAKELQDKVEKARKLNGSLTNEQIFEAVKEYVKDNPIAMVRVGIASSIEPNIGSYALLGKMKDLIFERKNEDTFQSKYNNDKKQISVAKGHLGAKKEQDQKMSHYSLNSKGDLKSLSDKRKAKFILNPIKLRDQEYVNNFVAKEEYNYLFKIGTNKVIYSYKSEEIIKDEDIKYIPKSNINIKSIIDSATWKFKGDIKR